MSCRDYPCPNCDVYVVFEDFWGDGLDGCANCDWRGKPKPKPKAVVEKFVVPPPPLHPACGSCPYFGRRKDVSEIDHAGRRIQNEFGPCQIRSLPQYPNRHQSEWCGEHPDFPEYVKYRRGGR